LHLLFGSLLNLWFWCLAIDGTEEVWGHLIGHSCVVIERYESLFYWLDISILSPRPIQGDVVFFASLHVDMVVIVHCSLGRRDEVDGCLRVQRIILLVMCLLPVRLRRWTVQFSLRGPRAVEVARTRLALLLLVVMVTL